MANRYPIRRKRIMAEGGLFAPPEVSLWDALLNRSPRRPAFFQPERIVLAAGSLDTLERRTFVERIIGLYPGVMVEDRTDISHNKIPPVKPDPYGRHITGKKTLIFGVHKSAVRFADERGNTCPNYWHFSPYGFCPYDCQYCYLAGTRSVYLSPSVKIFVNLPEIWDEIDLTAMRLATPTAFYLGKLQDALALEPLTGYVAGLVPRFARHPFARMTLLSKAADVGELPVIDHCGRTTLSWSMSPPEVHQHYERNVPSPDDRLAAMKKCADSGYPVRVNLMPIIPVGEWRDMYAVFLDRLLTTVKLSRLTFGGICIYPDARALMERKIGRTNPISGALEPQTGRRDDRRHRFPHVMRVEAYQFLCSIVRKLSPETELALCLETPDVMNCVIGRCNCVL